MTESMGKKVGAVWIASLELAYDRGHADARKEIEEKIANLPVRIRTGVELIERGSALNIIYETQSIHSPETSRPPAVHTEDTDPT